MTLGIIVFMMASMFAFGTFVAVQPNLVSAQIGNETISDDQVQGLREMGKNGTDPGSESIECKQGTETVKCPKYMFPEKKEN